MLKLGAGIAIGLAIIIISLSIRIALFMGALAMAKTPWSKPHMMARKCQYCKSQKPGMQPLTLFINGKPKCGYWHLKCFELAKKEFKS